MKTLILIRHAAAEESELKADDFHRPLSPAGEKESGQMASFFKKEGPKPDLIVSSPADRALETAHIFARRWGYDFRKILLVETIYKSHPLTQFLNLVRDFDNRFGRVAIVGHNPSLSDLARLYLRRRSLDIPKAGVLSIDFTTNEWKDCGPQNAVFRSFDVSREAVHSMKWAKPLRRELTSRLVNRAYDILAAVNPGNADKTRETLRLSLKKIASRFIKGTDPIRLTDRDWLDLLEAATPAETAASKSGPKGANRARRKTEKLDPAHPSSKSAAAERAGPNPLPKKKSAHG